MASRIVGCALLALTLATGSMTAQVHPNLERGFAVDKAYQLGEIDHVNLFNGNLTLTLPLGGGSTISEQLSLGLTATYNSKLWDRLSQPAQLPRLHPNRIANAGFGWTVTLGMLLGPTETDVNPTGGWRYVGADGSSRGFGSELHPGDPVTAGVLYSRDGTYLRMRPNGSNYYVEFPDGIVQEFEPWQDGQMGRYRLHATRDPHGNYYLIDYSVGDQWTIKDQYDRQTVVKFAATPVSPSGRSYEFQNLATAIESITIPGFEGNTAKYEFAYQAVDVRRGYCTVDGPPQDDKYVAAPLLKKITLYHGTTAVSTYEAEYDLTVQPPAEDMSCRAGTITSLKVPTQATLRWTYGMYRLPTDCRGDFEIDDTLGIYSRTIDAPSSGQFASDQDGTWNYLPKLTPETGGSFQCGSKTFPEPPPGEMTNTVTAPNGDETVHYFSVWPLGRAAGPSGETKDEFGLPFSRRGAASDATRFISSRVCKGSCDTSANWRRTTSVAYERDSSPQQFDADRRLKASRVIHHDDGDRFVDTEHSNFDGVGHYRTTTTTGDFGSGAVTRTTATNYNVRDPLVSASTAVLDTGTYSEEGSTFALPPVSSRWILNTYSSVVSAAGTSSAKKYACFDPLTGDLRALRVLTGSTAAATDLVSVFDRSTDTSLNGSAPGFVTQESHYGGDATLLQPTTKTALCDYVNATTTSDQPRPLAYRTGHTYSYGSRATSTSYRSDGTAMPFKSLNLAIDVSGLARTVTDTGGVATTYKYDPSGRLKEINPAGMATITYGYTPATSTTRAKVEVSQASSTGTLKNEIHFDSMGRPTIEKKTVESLLLRTKTTIYDAMGWKTSVTEWGSPSATVFSDFDAFGRAGTIEGPDGSTITVSYGGASAVTRTTDYQSPAGVQSTTVTESYDPLGRLVAVTQNAGPTTSGAPTGSAVVTSYGYDVADRLISVDIEPQTSGSTEQHRSFSYDGRGFLTKETHPEVGSDITYSYDARGHAVSKSFTTASDFDLTYGYDGAGRLRTVSSRFGTGFRLAKSFDFAETTDVSSGRLLTARRYNYLPGSSESYLVSEDYAYDPNGRPSSRTTKIKRVNGSTETLVREFTQGWTYNDLALPEEIVYPQCAGCGSSARTVDRGYVRGMLNSITGFITDIEYSPGGMTTKVVHSNGVTDVIAPSANGLSRPESITFQGLCTPSQVTTEPPDDNVERDTAVTLISGASGTAPIAYQWSKRPASSGTWTAIAGATGPTLSIGVSDETYFHLSVTNACGSDVSPDIRVTVYDRPTISVQPSSQTISGGTTTQLSVSANGTAPLTYRWYRGMSGDTSQPTAGTQTNYTTPALWMTTSYWVRVTNGLGHTIDSETATVTVELPAPTDLEAIRTSTGIRVIWNASAGAGQYRVERRSGSGFAPVATVPSSVVMYNDASIVASHAYVYQVVALDSSGGSASAPSNQDFAVAIAYPAVQVNTLVSVDPLNEILAGINALRRAAWSGATPLTWASLVSPPLPTSGAIVQASAIQALRTQLNLARGSLGFPSFAFTDAVPVLIKAVHVNDLQDGLR